MKYVVDIGEALSSFYALSEEAYGGFTDRAELDEMVKSTIEDQMMTLHSYVQGLEDQDFTLAELKEVQQEGHFRVTDATAGHLKDEPDGWLAAELFDVLVRDVLVNGDPHIEPKFHWSRVGNYLIVE